jgi:hypothetical protein
VKYAIKLQKGYWYDGAGAASVYDTAGWLGGKSLEVFRPTVYDSEEQALAIVRYWFNNNDHRDYVDGFEKDGVTPRPPVQWRYATIGGSSVGQYLRMIDDKTKKSFLILNPGPFPEVVEVEDDFGRPSWLVAAFD